MGKLFDIDGPVVTAVMYLTRLVYLNLLTILFSLPVVTAGASLAALSCLLMEMAEDRGGAVAQAFWKRFRQNLRNATPIWLIIAAVAALLYADYRILCTGETGLSRFWLVPAAGAGILLIAIYVYVFPLTAKFENTTAATFRNAAVLAAVHLPRTLVMIAITVFVPFLLLGVTSLIPLFFLVGISLPAYLRTLLYLPVIKKIAGEGRA